MKKKETKGLLWTILITAVILLIIYAVKGIFPFGDSIFGLKDFDHAYTPVYYKLWDVLHGTSSALFDWNLGYGLNCYGSLIMNSLLYPSTLFIYFFPREQIPNLMGIVVLLKVIKISAITYYVLNKLFEKVETSYKVAFTILYTLSGWTIFMLSNLLYLDVVGLFPLFVLAYHKLMKDNKWIMYYIVLTLCLLSNYYMAWMILFFIMGCTPLALLLLDIKDKKKKLITITLLTIMSLLSSCVLFLPSFYQSMTSTRMTESFEQYYSIGVLLLKIVYLFPLAVPIYFTIKQLFKKEDKKLNIFFILLLVYLLAGIVLEPINKMWHTGSYAGFPFRYSYIPSFILIIIGLYYLSKKENKEIPKKVDIVNAISASIITIIFIILAVVFKEEVTTFEFVFEIERYKQFIGLLFLFIVNIAGVFIASKCSKKIEPFYLIGMITITSLTYGLYYISPGEQTSKLTQSIKSNMELPSNDYNYKDYTESLNLNYPYILQVPSRENRLHIISKELKDMYQGFGYAYFDTMLYSYGGTLFSDTMLLNKYIFTDKELNEKLYNKIDEYNNIKLYESKYTAMPVIPYKGSTYNQKSEDIYLNQNEIYKKVFNKDENIIEDVIYKNNEIKINKDNIYYISFTCRMNCEGLELNDKIIVEQEYKNSRYNLELYSNENTSIKILSDNIDNLEIKSINIDKFIEFTQELNKGITNTRITNNKKVYEYETEEDTKLLIPLNYDSSFNLKVNGEKVPFTNNVYNMISLTVKKGKNTIEVEYTPKFFKEGIIISIVSVLLVVIISLLNKKFNFLDKKIILYPLFTICSLLFLAFFVKIYILSLF